MEKVNGLKSMNTSRTDLKGQVSQSLESISIFCFLFWENFSTGHGGETFWFQLNYLYFIRFLKDTNPGIFFAASELRGRWGAWIKEYIWGLTIKKGQKRNLLKE